MSDQGSSTSSVVLKSHPAGSVRVLPSELVNQIAAGEVVERPASVVKELIENALDAGATEIELLLENGGRRLIEIRDNGSGMSELDALAALQRHATSKIARFEDLSDISTLGFRGEALPAIASVSRFRLITFDGLSEHAVEIETDHGQPRVRPGSRDRGTTVRVGELFESVPARRKFLRSAEAEFRAIISTVSSYAFASFQRAFRVTHNGKVVLDLPAAHSARERVLQVLGADVEPCLVDLESTVGSCRVSGFATRGLRYGSRRHQYFFVNGRLVRDRVLTHAASRAADAYDFDGHPALVVFLEIPGAEVDVNVHPAKTEVRFRDSGQIHVAVEKAVRTALGGSEEGALLLEGPAEDPGLMAPASAVAAEPFGLAAQQGFSAPAPAADGTAGPNSAVFSALAVSPLFRQKPVVQPPLRRDEFSSPGDLQGIVIGQYRQSYILLDTQAGLRLIDQHVAHERVLYDRFEVSFPTRRPDSQRLLSAWVYEAGASEAAVLETHLEDLRAVGFDIERFSGRSFAVASIPSLLQREDLARFFRRILDASLDRDESHLTRVRDRVVASLACQAAIKVHRPMSGQEMASVVAELLGSSNPFACPHGRPIIVDIRHVDIEKHFHRR